MEVILREHVDNLGRRGEVVKVADGYARNYLLPRKLALLVTEGNRKQIERERAKLDAKEADEKRIVDAVAERLAGVEVVITRKVGETDALYGSVTTADIVEALNAKGFDIDKRKLQLAEPIKKVGEVKVPVKLHREVTVPVTVKVVAEGAPQTLTRSGGVEVELEGGTRRFPDAGRDDVPDLVARLVAEGERVYGVRVVRGTLEDAYLDAVEGA